MSNSSHNHAINNANNQMFGVDANGNLTLNGISISGNNVGVGHSNGYVQPSGINQQLAHCNCGCQGVSSMHGILSSGILGTLAAGPALTVEESKELEQLKKDREIESKRIKLQSFKNLPSLLRQQVVDGLMYQRFVRESNSVQAAPSTREQELEHKKSMSTSPFSSYIGVSSGLQYTISSGTTWYMSNIPLPTGLTEDDLIKAHNDACAEEALTDSK